MSDAPLPMFRYVVTYAQSGGEAIVPIQASYVQQGDKLITFKDSAHSVVLAVNADALISALREDQQD